MGLADREYMRERAGQRIWNDRKGRVELDGSPAGGAWFEAKNRGHDYQKGRWKPPARGSSGSSPLFRGSQARLQGFLLLLCAVAPLIGFYHVAKRQGWLGEWSQAAEIPFPASGSVTVNRAVDPRTARARFSVRTADANTVAQLYTLGGQHVLSLYVRANDDVTTNVPPGRYRLKIAEGQRWYGERFFGTSMTYETAVEDVILTRRQGFGIDLHRTPAGTLRTRPNFSSPSFSKD
jgi:hypothetical protein